MAAETILAPHVTQDSTQIVVPALRSVTALLDREIDDATIHWLRAYWTPKPVDLRCQVVRVENCHPRDCPAREDGDPALDLVARALRARPIDRRTAIGTIDSAARQFDKEDALTILFASEDRSAATRWVLREALGSALLVPSGALLPESNEERRAMLIARSAEELPTLVAWTRLLAPGVDIELRALFTPDSESPAKVLRELATLRVAVAIAQGALEADGRRVHSETVLVNDPPEHKVGLVASIARRSRWRKWLPARDAAGCRWPCPRLLISPNFMSASAVGGTP